MRTHSVPKRRSLLERAEQRVGGQQVRQHVAATRRHAPQPAEVVEPHVVDGRVGGIEPQRRSSPASQPDRAVADADDAVAEDGLHRLGDHPRGVGEVDDPGVRGEGRHPFGDLHGHRDGPQPVRQPARPRRLLPEQPEVEGDPLVGRAPLEPADPDRAEDEVRPLDRLVERGRDVDARRVRVPRRHLGQDPADGGEPVLVDVVQPHLVDPALVGVGQEGAVDEGRAEPATPEHRQPHGRTLPTAGDRPKGPDGGSCAPSTGPTPRRGAS